MVSIVGKSFAFSACGSVPPSPVLVLQRCLDLLGSPPGDRVRWCALLCGGDAEEELQAAAGQSTDPSFQCPGSACPPADAASALAAGLQRWPSLPGFQHKLSSHLVRFKDESRLTPSAGP